MASAPKTGTGLPRMGILFSILMICGDDTLFLIALQKFGLTNNQQQTKTSNDELLNNPCDIQLKIKRIHVFTKTAQNKSMCLITKKSPHDNIFRNCPRKLQKN